MTRSGWKGKECPVGSLWSNLSDLLVTKVWHSNYIEAFAWRAKVPLKQRFSQEFLLLHMRILKNTHVGQDIKGELYVVDAKKINLNISLWGAFAFDVLPFRVVSSKKLCGWGRRDNYKPLPFWEKVATVVELSGRERHGTSWQGPILHTRKLKNLESSL